MLAFWRRRFTAQLRPRPRLTPILDYAAATDADNYAVRLVIAGVSMFQQALASTNNATPETLKIDYTLLFTSRNPDPNIGAFFGFSFNGKISH